MFGNAEGFEPLTALRCRHTCNAGWIYLADYKFNLGENAVIYQWRALECAHRIDPCRNVAGFSGPKFG